MTDSEDPIELIFQAIADRNPTAHRATEGLDDMANQLAEEYIDRAPTTCLIQRVSVDVSETGEILSRLDVLEPGADDNLPHPAELLREAVQFGEWAGAIVVYNATATDRTGAAHRAKGVCVMVEGVWRSILRVDGQQEIRTVTQPQGEVADAMAGLLTLE